LFVFTNQVFGVEKNSAKFGGEKWDIALTDTPL